MGILRAPTASALAIAGGSIRKIIRQDLSSRIAPAIAGATPLATTAMADQIPTARAFLSAGKAATGLIADTALNGFITYHGSADEVVFS
ncbi:hypothetical protein CWO90_25425 [Bradyrhizobium sp. Leo121]|nr:hypothetical protein CWO90_25425 [Bradyrhizobium sp. Leo121]